MSASNQEPYLFRKLLSLSDFAYHKARPLSIVILLAMVAGFNIFVFPRLTQDITPENGPAILDARFGYQPGDAYAALAEFGESGRKNYFNMLAVADSIYPLFYGALLVLALSFVLDKSLSRNSLFRIFNLAPIDAVLFDFAENLSIMHLITAFPGRADLAARMASAFGILKWTVVALCIALIVAGLVRWIFLSWQERNDDAC